MPRVLNKKRDAIPAEAVYVGRGSKWGNPYVIGVHGTRADVIRKYEIYLQTRPDLLASVSEIAGKDLVCFCKPAACHADILLKLANGSIAK